MIKCQHRTVLKSLCLVVLFTTQPFQTAAQQTETTDSSNYKYFNISWLLVHDQAGNDYVRSNPYNYDVVDYPYYSFFGRFTPSIGVGSSKFHRAKKFSFRINQTAGFMYSNQDYRGVFGVDIIYDTLQGLQTIEVDESTTELNKFFVYYQIESRIRFLNHFFITPVVGFDLRVHHHIKSNSTLLKRTGMIDDRMRLRNHSNVNFNVGYSIGVNFPKKFEFGFTYKRSINQSLRSLENSKWKSHTAALYYNYKLDK